MKYRCEFALKVGERDHQYICDPNTPIEEAEYVLNYFIGMVKEIKDKASIPKESCQEPSVQVEEKIQSE